MYTRYRNTARKGFTLIEILIVVVILGILAAIVIPQFTDASTEASEASVRSQLQTIRGQLELYRVQHNDVYPDIADGAVQWAPLVNEDYLQAPPRNPLYDNATTVGAVGDATAWFWDGDDLFANDGSDGTFVE